MKKLLLLLFFYCHLSPAFCQPDSYRVNYWQQKVNYTIDVTLNDKDHTLSGYERMEYFNNSPDTLSFIWFHLWPNSYKNDKTAYTDQDLENGSTKFYFSSKEERGFINKLDFKVDNVTASTEDHPQHIDIIKLILPRPLTPGNKITISTPFNVKLPFNFSRGGHDGQSYQITQWYPKPAVYDKNGWHPMPYLDQGEFYSEFGSYDVRITVPPGYIIASTGELEKEEGTEMKTYRYKLDNIHDFAWFADKNFIINEDTCLLPSGKTIRVSTYYTIKEKEIWANSLQYAKKAIRFYSSHVGEYPYPSVKVVQGPASFGGGMEYPTITVISPMKDPKLLDRVIAHEIGHNWFYGILASNERAHPWMDEGINSYYDEKYTTERYGQQAQLERILFESQAAVKEDQPIEYPAEKLSLVNYGAVTYYKTAEWLRYLESKVGTESFNKGMQEYYRRWQFKHPQPADFKKIMEETAGRNLDDVFSYLGKTGTLPNQKRTGTRFAFLFDLKSINNYLKNPSKDLILMGPALGTNGYDQFMLGLFVTNMKLPPSPFQFFVAPMYATVTKDLTGIGFAYYSFYPKGIFRKIEPGVSASMFNMDQFKPDDGDKLSYGFRKIVPGIRLTLREKNARSTFHKYIQFKTFLINEEALRFLRRDTIVNGIDTSYKNRYTTIEQDRTLNQLKLVVENNRALYPYRGELMIEQSKEFVRAAFTGDYFFNYVKEGGLSLRIFGGKYFYRGSKTIIKQFSTDRYHFNMTGANGYEDYTYSDYFIGRNKFEGLASQQLMIRDGAFKIKTDLLADKIGKSDDWLAALNLSSTIPKALNPLSMLPVKIPLKVFLDIGTHAEAWKQESEEDRFLFDAGFQISLLKETINIYLPLVYSEVYRDYIQSTLKKSERFWKKISFSIDVSRFSLRKINRNIYF